MSEAERHDPDKPEDEVLGKAFDSVLIGRLLRYVKPHRRLFLATVITVVVTSALSLVGPLLVRIAIDGPLDGVIAGTTERPQALSELLWIVAVFGVVLLVELGGELLGVVLTNQTGQRIIRGLREQLFGHIQKMGLRYFDRHPVGRLVTRVTSDVEALNELFTSGLAMVFQDVFVIVFITIVLFILDVELAITAFLVVPALLVVSEIFKRRSRTAYRAVRSRLSHMNSNLQEALSGMRVVQLFTQERRMSNRFRDANRDFLRANLDTVFNYALFFPAVEILMAIGLAGIIWTGGREILLAMPGEETLTFGILVQFIMYLRRLFEPIRQLSEKYNILQAAMAAGERVFKVLDTKVEVPEPDSPVALPPRIRGAIEFDNVTFAYREGEPVIHELGFKIEPGESVAIVGATGAGKSTVLNLLLRFYDVNEGTVQVDGHDVRSLALPDLRRRVGIVLQDVFLFSRSIEENLRLGNPAITRERIERAARTVNAARFIDRLDNGYESQLSERGANLSVGERQLLAFARALAWDPEILILDEATSSVDTETEGMIQDALHKLMRNRTSIIIAHRLSTIREVDRILVFHKGRIREQGTHDQLLAERGIYHKLVQLQYRGA